MNVSRRLVQIERKMSASYADNKLQEELLRWLDINAYEVGGNFHEWCNKMPNYLVKSFADHVKQHVNFRTLMNVIKDSG